MAAGLSLVGSVGCAPSNADMLEFLREHEHQVSASEYRIDIPDTIAISAPRVPEIHESIHTIQPDGKITLDLLREVYVAGMTAKEVAAKLEIIASRYYTDPQVRVKVADYASKIYYVVGYAGQVGPRPYTGRDTLLDAVAKAGTDFRSWTTRVKVVRPTRDGERPKTVTVNVDRMIRTGDWSKNILLEPDDIVFVPPTPLAWMSLRIREVLFPIGPMFDAYQAPAEFIYASDIYKDDGRFFTARRGSVRQGGG